MSGEQGEAITKLGEHLKQKIAVIDYPKQIDGFDFSINDNGLGKRVYLQKKLKSQRITIEFILDCGQYDAESPIMKNSDMSEVVDIPLISPSLPKPISFYVDIFNKYMNTFLRLEYLYFGMLKENIKCSNKINKICAKNRRGFEIFDYKEISNDVATTTLKNILHDFLIENGVKDELFEKVLKYATMSNNLDDLKLLHDIFFKSKLQRDLN